VPEINTALEAKIKWVRMTTPGAAPEKEKPKPMTGLLTSIIQRPETRVYGD
jgi:hypothetical protein